VYFLADLCEGITDIHTYARARAHDTQSKFNDGAGNAELELKPLDKILNFYSILH